MIRAENANQNASLLSSVAGPFFFWTAVARHRFLFFFLAGHVANPKERKRRQAAALQSAARGHCFVAALLLEYRRWYGIFSLPSHFRFFWRRLLFPPFSRL